jgi:hypothetical protein
LRSPNEVRGNNRLTVVIENTLIITVLYHKIEDFKRYFHKKLIYRNNYGIIYRYILFRNTED